MENLFEFQVAFQRSLNVDRQPRATQNEHNLHQKICMKCS